jgi:hypothetical protein
MSLTTPSYNTSNFKKRRNDAGISMKTKDRGGKLGAEAGMCMKKRGSGLGTRGWGLVDEGLPAPSAAQHHLPNLLAGSTEASRLGKVLLLTERSGNVIENKGSPWKTWERSWNLYENKRLSS